MFFLVFMISYLTWPGTSLDFGLNITWDLIYLRLDLTRDLFWPGFWFDPYFDFTIIYFCFQYIQDDRQTYSVYYIAQTEVYLDQKQIVPSWQYLLVRWPPCFFPFFSREMLRNKKYDRKSRVHCSTSCACTWWRVLAGTILKSFGDQTWYVMKVWWSLDFILTHYGYLKTWQTNGQINKQRDRRTTAKFI